MKMSLSQMIAIVCILSVGFVTVAPFLQQEAYGGADQYDYDANEIRSFATGQVVGYQIVSGGVVNTSHYGYYHNPGSSTAAWEHRQNWPSGHGGTINMNIVGTIWV